jgi:MFS family permease
MATTTDEKDAVNSVNHNRMYVLTLLTLVGALNFVDRQILAVLLEPIGQEFDLPDSALGLLSGISFAIFYATLGIPIAVLADRSNRRNIISVCVVLFSCMTAICGSVTSFIQLMVARIGVGVGEAGTGPASQSIISDLFPLEQRPTAMAVLSAGSNLGLMIGFLVGGWVSEWYGWRVAFLAVGLPGIVLAGVIYFTSAEPKRSAPPSMDSDVFRSIADSFSLFLRIPSFLYFTAGASLYGMAAYGVTTWMPTYFIRYHGLTTGEAGTLMALTVGLLGGLGAIAGGAIASRMSRTDVRWNAFVPAIAIGVSLPFLVFLLTTGSTSLAVAGYIIPALLASVYNGPSIAVIQEVVPPERRAIAASLYALVFNLIGLGLGPFAVGVLSDLYAPALGDQSLRWAMMSVLTLGVAGVVVYYYASLVVGDDLEKIATKRAARSSPP